MKYPLRLPLLAALACAAFASPLPFALVPSAMAQGEGEKQLEFGNAAPTSKQVSVKPSSDPAAPGTVVTIVPGEEGYPGVNIKPQGFLVWNLASYGHIAAKVTNLGTKNIHLSLRVDNDKDWRENPWNSESVSIKPGETKSVDVIFGYAYGKKPGYPVNPAEVSNIMLFTSKSKEEQVFRIDELKAAGPAGQKPDQDPRSIRIKPENGVILTAQTQAEAKNGANAAVAADGKSVDVTVGKGQSVVLKPEKGRWDFRDGYVVSMRVKNAGSGSVSPRAKVNSQSAPTDTATTASAIAPGATGEISISFIPSVPWEGEDKPEMRVKQKATKYWGEKKGTGTKFTSDAVSGIEIMAGAEQSGEAKLVIDNVTLSAPPADVPEWLGQRPPVDGNWKLTFEDNFDGNEIDLSKWNIYTANYWDKRTGFSKDNVIVEDGMAKLRYEKRRVKHNDDPEGKEFEYASGFLDTYGKWVQRYGYFETRVKLPTAPGLWPAWWTMPDRGIEAGEQWKRASTEDGGMEFDILEHLTRWGSYRYNHAFHWDGYGKAHQAIGSSMVYTAHDKDGFITSGLLWLPGEATYYQNGKVVGHWKTDRICDVESYPILYMVSGGWDNNSLDAAQLPADYVIDYVRIWQRADLASQVDGVQSTQRTPAAPTKPD